MNNVPFTCMLLTVAPAVETCRSPSWTVSVVPAGTPTPAAGCLVSVTVGPVTGGPATGGVPVDRFGPGSAPGVPLGPPEGDESRDGLPAEAGADTDGPPPEPIGPGGSGLWLSRLATETVPNIRPAAAAPTITGIGHRGRRAHLVGAAGVVGMTAGSGVARATFSRSSAGAL